MFQKQTKESKSIIQNVMSSSEKQNSTTNIIIIIIFFCTNKESGTKLRLLNPCTR